ncbi:MAG: carbohydrate binding family 9 domain-containing protein [Microscillaceae bacterium]|nr:carbohydrate binding family 9 domain-containing protein [Microscillaceae bacterium]
MKNLFFGLFAILACILSPTLLAQKSLKSEKIYQISAQKIAEKLDIDGELSEKIWQSATLASDFYQSFPFDSSFALSKTEAMVAFDDHFLYVAAKCYDDLPGEYVVQSLRRDFDGGVNDFFTVYLDTFGDQTNGFAFGISPLGVQREGLISDGGNNDLNLDWDNKWFGNAKIHSGYYTIEMAIPFKTLRFRGGSAPWRINFGRIDRKRNEISSWVPIPRNFRLTNLAFTGEVLWQEELKKSGPNVSFIPYVSAGTSKDHIAETPTKNTANLGADIKIGITSSLNLDLTFNPDFSQVEVDRQVTNLDRFEIFFPERRQFFLENNDLFARFGFPNTRPFFSRRIGIARDTNTNLIVLNPILYGARLSGKVDKNWRIGLLNMQTARKPLAGIEGQNYTVAAAQRRMFARSVLGIVVVNRQRTSGEGKNFSFKIPDFDRIIGLEYNLNSKDSKWTGEAYYHRLFRPNNTYGQYTHGTYLEYNVPTWNTSINYQYVGKNYQVSQIGFVPRQNFWNLGHSAGYRFFPKVKGGKLNNHGPQINTNLFWLTDTRILTDRANRFSYRFNFNNGAFGGIWLSNEFTKLFFDFDPTNTGGQRLLSGTDYTVSSWYIRFESNPRKRLSFSQGVGDGGYYNGNLFLLEGDITWRIQPFGILNLSYSYNRIRLPQPYNSSDLLLISPRFDFTFSKSVFFTLFTQYNNQINNINLNARFQWRFKPVSDLFIVYTDNYFSTETTLRNDETNTMRRFQMLQTKNRAIVLKLTYWLNL